MDAVTYPQKSVIEAIDQHVIALRVPHDTKPLAVKYNVVWTPALFILDPEGKRHMDSVGFRPPEELIPWIILGRGKMYFDREELDKAVTYFNDLLEDHPDSHAAPEALFYAGVSEYKQTHDGAPLKRIYEQLGERYPASIWAQKSLPYRLL